MPGERIHARGDSPLTRFVDYLDASRDALERCAERDDHALTVLNSPGLPHAIARAEQIDLAPACNRRSVPRHWTRRDAKRLAVRRGWFTGVMAQPECRVARLLKRLRPCQGFARHELLLQAALDEARAEGTAPAVAPRLAEARERFEALLAAAHSTSQDDARLEDLQAAALDLHQAVAPLMSFLPAPTPEGQDGPCDAYSWRYAGEAYPGMTAKPWNFAAALFRAMPGRVDLRDLAAPVLGDKREPVTVDAAGSWRREANGFFKRHGIPLRTKVLERRYALMVER